MVINESFKPTASDFADYVYCGAQWFYTHTEESNRMPGKDKNEEGCINWVLKEFDVTKDDIIFNGTGINNKKKSLSAEVEPAGTIIKCKPDLIISKNTKNLLFEFKSVKQQHSLKLPEFDSVHAQVWCYTKITEIPISQFHLLRYFEDPNVKSFGSPRYDHRTLTSIELNDIKFQKLFNNYIKTIELFKSGNYETKKVISRYIKEEKPFLYLFNPPQENKYKKCSNCIYKIRPICNFHGL